MLINTRCKECLKQKRIKQTKIKLQKAKTYRDNLHIQFDCHLIADADKEVVKLETILNMLEETDNKL